MAVHKINIRANTLEKSKDKAPFLGVYQSNGTNNEEAMLPHVAEAAGQKDIQTRAILEGVFAAISKKNRADGPTRMHLPGGISAFVGITGSFPASDSAFDPEKNKVVQILGLSPKLRNELVNVQPEIVGEADGTRIELNRVFDLAQKQPGAIIYGQRPFRCQGINIVTTDEGARVFIRNRKGVEFDVVVDEVVSSQEFTAHTAELLEAGDYWVVIETRGGNPDGTIREDDKPVKYLKVDPPAKKTLTVHPTAAAALEGNDPLTEIDRSAGCLYLRAEGHAFAEGETLTLTLDSPGLEEPETHELEIETVDGAPAVTNPFCNPVHAGLTGLITMENADVRGELAFVPEE